MDRAQALLEGGLTQRLHATPHLQPYTVAEHSWGMAMLLLALHPGPRTQLLWACLTHDVAERWTGDVPATAKWHMPGIGEALDKAERHINEHLQFEHAQQLPAEDHAWLKALDLAELWVYCRRETAMGNRLVEPISAKCYAILGEGWVPAPVARWVAQRYTQPLRTDDTFGLE